MTVHPNPLAKDGVSYSLIDHFLEVDSVYAIMATILIISCIASFMSTADPFILALVNHIVEDF